MKIAILSPYFNTNTGGAEISTKLFIDELIKQGYDIHIITFTKKQPDQNYNIHQIKLPIDNPSKISLLLNTNLVDNYLKNKIKHILKKIKPDILHLQDLLTIPAGVKAVKELNKISKHQIKTISTIRDTRFNCNLTYCQEQGNKEPHKSKEEYKHCLKKTSNNLIKNNLAKTLAPTLLFPLISKRPKTIRKYLRLVDKNITVSNFIKNTLNNLNITNTETIYNLQPDWKIDKQKKENKKENNNIILALGRIDSYKGFQYLALAGKQINKNIRIIGEGPYKNKLAQIIRQNDITNVELKDKIPHDKLIEEYSKAYAIVLPSIWHEPLSRIIFEAHLTKTPIIATNTGGTKELVIHKKTGLTIEPKNEKQISDAINTLSKDKKLYKKIQENQEKLMKKHKKKQLDRYNREYQKLHKFI